MRDGGRGGGPVVRGLLPEAQGPRLPRAPLLPSTALSSILLSRLVCLVFSRVFVSSPARSPGSASYRIVSYPITLNYLCRPPAPPRRPPRHPCRTTRRLRLQMAAMKEWTEGGYVEWLVKLNTYVAAQRGAAGYIVGEQVRRLELALHLH